MKVTPWFDGTIKPCKNRPGWYERRLADAQIVNRQWWDGRVWRIGGRDGYETMLQTEPLWRGVEK